MPNSKAAWSVPHQPDIPQPDTCRLDDPDTCRLDHKVFGTFASPLFRHAETDRVPVMMVRMGERDVSMPLRSLAREFRLSDETADGRMLHLIAESLEYVSALRIGDKLPSEVLTGDASWEPSANHIRIANARLQIQLVEWLRRGTDADPVQITPEKLATGKVDATIRELVHAALVRAAEVLGLPTANDVVGKIEDLAHELAYIEALRDRLLHRLQSMIGKLEQLARLRIRDGAPSDTLTRVRQLSDIARQQIGQRFDEQDAHIGEVMSALRHIESHRTFIRSNRDWLYRSQRGWEPTLTEWDAMDPNSGEPTRPLLERTYQFLAPRFMPVTEWISFLRPKPKPKVQGMVW